MGPNTLEYTTLSSRLWQNCSLKEMKLRHVPRRGRRGATVFTFAMWFVLSLIVTIGIITAFQSTRDSMRASDLRSQLTRAAAIVEEVHSYSGVFAAESLLHVLSGRGFSGKELARVSAGSYVMTSPYDTAITIVGDGARDFTITVADLPQQGCVAALSAFQDSGAGLDSASVGSTTLTVPLTTAALTAACDNTTNTVALTF